MKLCGDCCGLLAYWMVGHSDNNLEQLHELLPSSSKHAELPQYGSVASVETGAATQGLVDADFVSLYPPVSSPEVRVREPKLERWLEEWYMTDAFREGMEPDLSSSETVEWMVWDDNWKEVHLTDKLSSLTESTVFLAELPDGSEGVVKFAANCLELDSSVEPVVRGFFFHSLVHQLQLAVAVYHLSPPVGFVGVTESGGWKTDFQMDERDLQTCVGDTRSKVRFMVMEHAGVSLRQWRDNVLEERISAPVISVLRFLSFTLAMVQDLHKNGIVHGDIHAKNVLVRKGERGGTEMSLVDFEKSFFAADFSHLPEQDGLGMKEHFLLSPYAMAGSRLGFRDDVFNAVWMAAYLMQGRELEDMYLGRDGWKARYNLKQSVNFFGNRPLPRNEHLEDALDTMRRLVQGMGRGVDVVPPYAKLQAAVSAGIAAVSSEERYWNHFIRSEYLVS